jgi:transposase
VAADAGLTGEQIARSVNVGTSTVYRAKRRFVEGGVENAIHDRPRHARIANSPARGRRYSSLRVCEASLGKARWTLEILAGELVRLTGHERLSRETVRRRPSENDLKPWQKKMRRIPKVYAEYVGGMEDVLDLHAEDAAADPVVCFDEPPVQLIGETRIPIAAESRQASADRRRVRGAMESRTCSCPSTRISRGGT